MTGEGNYPPGGQYDRRAPYNQVPEVCDDCNQEEEHCTCICDFCEKNFDDCSCETCELCGELMIHCDCDTEVDDE